MFYGRFAVKGDNPVDNRNRKNEKVSGITLSGYALNQKNGRENNSKVYGRQINQWD
jgi:hypothetical protein